MPKTTVYEYRELGSSKHEVWFSEQGLATTPTHDSVLPEDFYKSKFSGAVPVRTNGGHNRGALLD